MTTSNIPVVPLFQEKLILFKELSSVLTKERQWIINADVDELWRVSDTKKAIASKIDMLRSHILKMLTDAGIDHKMIPETFNGSKIVSLLPVELRKELAATMLSLGIVKEEVRSLSRENKQYIESYLSMLDDLMSIFTGKNTSPVVYDSHQKMPEYEKPMLFHQEV